MLEAQGQGAGWASLFEGHAAAKWAKTQEACHKRAGSRRSGRRWVTELIKKLFDAAWGLRGHRSKVANSKKSQAMLRSAKVADVEICSQLR